LRRQLNSVLFYRSSTWRPDSVDFNTTWIKSFSELVPLAGLSSALVVTNGCFEEAFKDGFISHFTAEVDLTVIAGVANKVGRKKIFFCCRFN
jgi:hypothetical protein